MVFSWLSHGFGKGVWYRLLFREFLLDDFIWSVCSLFQSLFQWIPHGRDGCSSESPKATSCLSCIRWSFNPCSIGHFGCDNKGKNPFPENGCGFQDNFMKRTLSTGCCMGRRISCLTRLLKKWIFADNFDSNWNQLKNELSI